MQNAEKDLGWGGGGWRLLIKRAKKCERRQPSKGEKGRGKKVG